MRASAAIEPFFAAQRVLKDSPHAIAACRRDLTRHHTLIEPPHTATGQLEAVSRPPEVCKKQRHLGAAKRRRVAIHEVVHQLLHQDVLVVALRDDEIEGIDEDFELGTRRRVRPYGHAVLHLPNDEGQVDHPVRIGPATSGAHPPAATALHG